MATISSLGIGSGIDLNGMLSGLMAAERQPITILNTQKKAVDAQVSALGRLKGSVEALNTASKALAKPEDLYGLSGKFSDETIAKASVSSKATQGSHRIEVQKMASAHKLASVPGLDLSQGGKLEIFLGPEKTGETAAVSVDIRPGASMEELRDAINRQNKGVSATIVNGKDGKQLVLTSKESGEAGAMRIKSDVAQLGSGAFAEIQKAQDAELLVDGIAVKSSSNTVKNVVSGVDLTLTKEGKTTLDIVNDPKVMQEKLQAFVKAYNDTHALLKDLGKYDPATKTGAALSGDASLRDIQNQLNRSLSIVPSGASDQFKTLASVGVSLQKDGTLKLDEKVFQAAAASGLDGVVNTVSAYGASFEKTTYNMNRTASNPSESGVIASRTKALTDRSKGMGDRMDAMEVRMGVIENRYRKQFERLDVMMAQMQSKQAQFANALKGASLASYAG